MKKKAQKISVTLSEEILQLADENYRKMGYKNRSAFIEAAIGRLANSRTIHSFADDLSKIYSGIERSELKDMEERLAKLCYKIAIEIAQTHVLLGSLIELTQSDFYEIRKRAYDLVRKTKGTVSLPQAARKGFKLKDKSEDELFFDAFGYTNGDEYLYD